ncbi:DNA-binding domain-containing protein [Rhodoferax sp. GW822-FHT02A01]|uniref:DNA-binding domain-containing protein n=1 Tax=Rhodoferax sp. GW822-FHT02A01 TaxID=3141537 RepID=UPI00315DA591
MSSLASQQQALLEALFAWPVQAAAQRLAEQAIGVGASPQRGLQVYQANGHVLAERALQDAYPVLVQMLGTESFAHLARALWHAHPPTQGDIAQWGERLAEFVQQSAQLQEEPYLADVARTEWAMHLCSRAVDQEAALSTLVLLTTEDPQTLGLILAPGLATVCSPWPVASILLAHLQGTPSLAEVGAQLRSRTPQDVVVWRQDFQVRLRQTLPGECALLTALMAGASLEGALDQAPLLDFPQWLPMAVQTGLVLGGQRLTDEMASNRP